MRARVGAMAAGRAHSPRRPRASVACRLHRRMRATDPGMFTTVASYLDPIEAQIARGLLQSEGIDAHVGDEHLSVANWEWRLAIGGTRVRVADADAERARAILRAMDAGEYAIDDDQAPADAQLHAPDRESPSSRLAWLAFMLLSLPLPWRRRARGESVVHEA